MSGPGLRSRGLGAYLGLAVGDALGATVEFMTPREIAHRYGRHRDIVGGGWLRLAAGQVTDDTGMALALGASIIEHGDVDAAAVAGAFSDWMRQKPVDIGHTVRRGLAHFRRTGEVAVPHDDQNAGNGACMRCLPVALRHCFSDEPLWVAAARRQAHVTHNSRVADAGCETLLRMVLAARRGAARADMLAMAARLVEQHPVYRFDGRRVENPGGWLVETLQAVFQALTDGDDFEAVLVDVVNRGGDADTTGAIAGMLAGALFGLDAIPDRWLHALDPAVANRCGRQAEALLSLAAGQARPERGSDHAGV